MGNKRLSWISFAVSIIVLVFSVIALVNRCPTQDLHFDYMGVIVGVLALLVTSLIGAQVGQYVFVDKKIEKITTKISRVVSRKVAAEVAQREASKKSESVAKETAEAKAMDVVGGLPDDIAFVLRGKDWMNKVVPEIMTSEFMTAIDNVVNALREFKQCGSEALYQSTVDDALETLNKYFGYTAQRGGLRVLKGKKPIYEGILNDLRSEHLSESMNYLSKAAELDKEEDNKISLQEFDEMLK